MIKLFIIHCLFLLFFSSHSYAAITRDNALRVIDHFVVTMSPVTIEKTSQQLKIWFDWTADILPLAKDAAGGAITHSSPSSGQIGAKIKGGVARHPDIGKVGFALILCHEIGHFLGEKGTDYSNIWIKASEAAADKFAIQVCLPELGYNQAEIAEGSFQVSQFLFDLFNAEKPGLYIRPDPATRATDYRQDFASSGVLQCRFEQMLYWSGNQTEIASNCLRND